MAASRDLWLLAETGVLRATGEAVAEGPIGRVPVNAGYVRRGQVALIADYREVWTGTDGKWTKRASAPSKVSLESVAIADRGQVLVGTEPARVAWAQDGALRFVDAFERVPEQREWTTPFGAPPAVRSLAVGADGTLYADIHVGWINRSTDGGRSWKCLTNGLDMDVHMVGAHPHDPDVVFAATAEGFHISHDRGDSWANPRKGMPYHYQRSCAVFPDRDVYLVSTARYFAGKGARLYRTEDEGKAWTHVEGLPAIDENINTFQIATLAGGRAFVVIDNTALYESQDYGATWREIARGLPAVHALLTV